MIFCFDLDGSLDKYPDEFRAIISGLRAQKHEVHIVTGARSSTVTPDIISDKIKKLEGLDLANYYDKLVIVANPQNNVAKQKVEYMKNINAHVLFDNDPANIKAAKKANFLALRVE